MLGKYLSPYFGKHIKGVIFLFLGGVLLSGCHRDLTDPFIPKDKKFNTQFKFDVKRNRTVEKHVSFAREKGKFKDTFAGSKGRGRNGGRSKDSYASKSKHDYSGSRFSKAKGRVVEKGFLPSKRNNESFSSKTGGSKSQNRFNSKTNRVVTYKKKGSRQWSGKESFGGKQNSGQGMYRFDKKSKRIVSKGKFTLFGSKKHSRDMGSYSGKKQSSGRMYVFNEKKRQVTKTNAAFSGFRRFRSGDSFGGKRNSYGGEFSFNSKKKRVSKRVSLFKPRTQIRVLLEADSEKAIRDRSNMCSAINARGYTTAAELSGICSEAATGYPRKRKNPNLIFSIRK